MCQKTWEECKEEAITREIPVSYRCWEEGYGLASHVLILVSTRCSKVIPKHLAQELFIFNNLKKILNNV